jgi:hypothetical protein
MKNKTPTKRAPGGSGPKAGGSPLDPAKVEKGFFPSASPKRVGQPATPNAQKIGLPKVSQ